MNTVDFLEYLYSLDIQMGVDGEQLRISVPQGTLTPELRAELGARKAEILTFLRQPHLKDDISPGPIQPVSRQGNIPLSFAQERLWFLDQLEPGNSAYNVALVYRLRGSLDVGALEKSFNEIVQRHEVLRTTFVIVDGQPIQVIAPSLTLPLSTVDLRNLSEPEQEAQVERFMSQERKWTFELDQAPLLRTTLLHLDEHNYVLLLTMHHIIFDSWSLGVLFQELSVLYNAFSTGKASPLPELSVQYADFAVWQREWLQGEVLKTQLDYWKQHLDGVPPPLELPTDRRRPAVRTFRGAKESFVLSKIVSKALTELSQQEGVTLFMMLLTAFNVLLHRYSGQDDIVVGTPIANRNRAETESLIGFFVNTLVLRTDHSGDPSFRELLARVRKTALEAYAYQDLPFEKLVEELDPGRHLDHNPLFQVMFALQNAPEQALELAEMTVDLLPGESETEKFDLTLSMVEGVEGLEGSLTYNTDLFDGSTIKRMVEHFQTLLGGIVGNPQLPISQLPLLTPAERHQLLVAWNDTRACYPRNHCVHQLFEVQVKRTPDAIAVIYGDRQLTYNELNTRANQLAHHLKKCGVGPDMLVGICLERSPEMVTGLLGILKAGGVYVPLDPTYPKERLAFMIEDTQIPLLLTQEYLLDILPKDHVNMICLNQRWEAIGQESEANPATETTADSLAYVMYTSGSIGTPKGISIPHRAINRLVFNTNYIKLESDHIVAQASNTSFDAATFEIWGALLHGAQLVGITKDVILSPQDFAEQIRKQRISTLFLTTALFNQLAQKIPGAFQSVQHLLFGGEAVNPRWVKEVLDNGPPQHLFHVYGPTESTTFATWHLVQGVPEGATTIPIGRPITNTEIYLLDRNLQPVPIGIPGELYIGGDGLAREYLNRPELTAEKFILNPFSDKSGARLYKTGDLARYLPDGNIEFLGRIDHQVKLRGFRIELGEIEVVLGQHPSVREAAVTIREDLPGDKRLVAYLILKQEQTVPINQLRSFLQEKLPNYMIPSTFVMLDAWPLTPSGKVNRQLLPKPDDVRQEPQGSYVAPRDQLELQVTKIWENVLNVRPIGVRDDFFDQGGHSLLAVALFGQLEKLFGKNLPLATLFQAPTIEQLVEVLRGEGWTPLWASLVPIQPQGSKTPFFCVHAVGGNVLSLRDLARHLGDEQPFYALQSQGLDGKARPPERVEEMAAYYIEEMRTIQPTGPYYLGGQSSGGLVAFEMAQQLQAQGEEVAVLALIDSQVLNNPKVPRSFRNRFSYELRNLLRLGPTYVQKETKYRWKQIKIGVERVIVKTAKRIYASLERPMPQNIRYLYVREVIRRAVVSYCPKTYQGRITLFRATDTFSAYLGEPQDSRGGWDGLTTGGLEIHDISGPHNLEKEPYVGILAEKLKLCLDKEQTNSAFATFPESGEFMATIE